MPSTGGGLAAQIDSFLKGYGSPLAGYGNVFVAAGKKYGVDPRLTVAISGAESTFGKYLFAPYNAWGWMSDDRYAWGNWETGINKVTRGLATGYIGQGLKTPAQIVDKYNPADPGNREHWANTVSTFLREMGATPSTTTTKRVVQAAAPSSVPLATVPTASVPTASVPSFTPMRFTPTSAGLQGALQTNLQTIAQRGHLSGGEMLANINAGSQADQSANLTQLAQVDAYNKALEAARSTQQPAPAPETQSVGDGTTVPVPASKQPPAQPTADDKPATKGTKVVLDTIRDALGTPYVWGGAKPGGFDCSGLLVYAYGKIGISLPHGSVAQYHLGQAVSKENLRPGDAVFFHNAQWDAGYGPGHVGIYIGGGQFIQAPHTGDVVKVSNLSERWYADHYVGARRYG